MKNPCDPVFSNNADYKRFRAKFAIWNKNLKTLDGTDLKDDEELIKIMRSREQNKMLKLQGQAPLETIPEQA